jgi:hypothetical protein
MLRDAQGWIRPHDISRSGPPYFLAKAAAVPGYPMLPIESGTNKRNVYRAQKRNRMPADILKNEGFTSRGVVSDS